MTTANAASADRVAHLTQFYAILDRPKEGVGGARMLATSIPPRPERRNRVQPPHRLQPPLPAVT